MKLTWAMGSGPETLEEMADEVEREGKLVAGEFVDKDGLRCLWGVILDYHNTHGALHETIAQQRRELSPVSYRLMYSKGCAVADNDAFQGTPEERCQEMVRRLREIARQHDRKKGILTRQCPDCLKSSP